MRNDTKKIVSSDSEQLILVSPEDAELGYLSKLRCHDGEGTLHRAFSLFIFNRQGELLLQRRAEDKRLWPLYWSNSCCSHPRKGESMEQATRRRLTDELNIEAEVEFVYKFSYQASYRELGSEHELCWVYLGRSDATIILNKTEVAEARFISMAALQHELVADSLQFTPWFRLEWERLTKQYGERLADYTGYPT